MKRKSYVSLRCAFCEFLVAFSFVVCCPSVSGPVTSVLPSVVLLVARLGRAHEHLWSWWTSTHHIGGYSLVSRRHFAAQCIWSLAFTHARRGQDLIASLHVHVVVATLDVGLRACLLLVSCALVLLGAQVHAVPDAFAAIPAATAVAMEVSST